MDIINQSTKEKLPTIKKKTNQVRRLSTMIIGAKTVTQGELEIDNIEKKWVIWKTPQQSKQKL